MQLDRYPKSPTQLSHFQKIGNKCILFIINKPPTTIAYIGLTE